MSQPMSEERIQHISAVLSVPDVGGISEALARELLAEVQRLRAEADTVTAMREYLKELKRNALRLLVCMVSAAVMWIVLDELVPVPWNWVLAIPAWWGLGNLIGACEFWIEERLEARRG